MNDILITVLFSISLLPSNYGEDNIELGPPKLIDCSTLRMGQYLCPDPTYTLVDPKTQQIQGCTKENKAKSMYREWIINYLPLSNKTLQQF